jgi:hypothetical protein
MKLVFFAFKHRYRYKDLNNFLNSRLYGKYFILNLGGPFKHLLAKLFLKLNIGYAISCDARPLIKNKNSGINFFIRGTNLNIPAAFKNLSNNFVSIKNPFKSDRNIFQLYPVNIINTKITKKPKIVFISSVDIKTTIEQKNLWDKYKDVILKDFAILENNTFWEKCLVENNKQDKYIFYRKFKILLRYEIIKFLKKQFKEKFILIGDDWQKYFSDSLPSNFDYKYLKNIYKGNICLDTGSTEGSSSLYTRSNHLIESGGLIIQSKQIDSDEIWGNLENKIIFNDLKSLESKIDEILNDNHYSNKLLNEIYSNFSNTKKLTEQSLDYILNNSK